IESCEVRLHNSDVSIPGENGFYSIQRNSVLGNTGEWELYFRQQIGIGRGISLEDNEGLEGDSNLWKRSLKNELIRKCESKIAIKEIEYDSQTEEIFDEAISYYEKVVEDYPQEKDPEKAVIEETETYGELALKEAIKIS